MCSKEGPENVFVRRIKRTDEWRLVKRLLAVELLSAQHREVQIYSEPQSGM
jgi:hypothetical protein